MTLLNQVFKNISEPEQEILLSSKQRLLLTSRMIINSYRGFDAEPKSLALIENYREAGISEKWIDDAIDLFRQAPEQGLKAILEVKGLSSLPDSYAHPYLDELHDRMENALLGFIQEHDYVDNRKHLANVLRHYFHSVDIQNEASEIFRESSFSPISHKRL